MEKLSIPLSHLDVLRRYPQLEFRAPGDHQGLKVAPLLEQIAMERDDWDPRVPKQWLVEVHPNGIPKQP